MDSFSTSTDDKTNKSPGQQEDDYIAFVESDSESDLEIDLTTKPANKRQIKVAKHFRKGNPKVYDNISVYAPPDSNLIFRCSQKRADWYLSRSLARSLSPTSIHLTFVPAGQGRANDPYYLEERDNKCVVCGVETVEAGATMLHVVPEQYRKWFPIRLKSHSSHDIVLACPQCTGQWDREAAVIRKKIVTIFNIPLEGVGWVKDHEAGMAKRAAGAVVSDWNTRWGEVQKTSSKVLSKRKKNIIPPERMKVLEKTVYDWWTKAHKDVVNDDNSGNAESVSTKRDPPEESREEEQESKKKPKLENDKDETNCSTSASTLASSDGSSTTPAPKSSSTQQQTGQKHNELPIIPQPPPGHSTQLSETMLRAALDAKQSYKAPDYKEHGQLVIARVMASSPEFYQDPEELPETIETWKDAAPLDPAPDGWRNVTEFIRTWRREFLSKAKPQHLSSEWRVENSVQRND
ncbi:hypothetical protein BG011_001920 [Mortierella polycephala]|uniref:Uncharacterized protein n=1 Tax=Mortierella polycephala TaxID=41804 RepID=A0A9P6Q7U3_9FUNG|nr:hypothetical protein BG011_001920 [Mortierella polycephala]